MDLLPLSITAYNDFKGRTLVTAVIDNWPWLDTETVEGVIKITRGIDYQILEILADKLNFRYVVFFTFLEYEEKILQHAIGNINFKVIINLKSIFSGIFHRKKF